MNNSFARCIDAICGQEITALATYKYSVFGGKTLVLEGHKGICNYSCEQISFKITKGSLVVVGKGLQIRCLDKNFAVVSGQITSVEVAQ